MNVGASLTFDAGLLARGWLAVSLAAGSDEALPILCGTLAIETYSDGIRLTSTDRYMLLTAWISADGRDADDERGIEEAPDAVTVARDPDSRGRALLGYLNKLAARALKDSLPVPLVSLHVDVPADDDTSEPSFPGMELRQVILDYPDHEKLALPIVQGEYPNWREIIAGHKPQRTQNVTIAPDLLLRIGKVGKLAGGFVNCTLGGDRGMVAVEVSREDFQPTIRGGIMPIRLAEVEAVAS